MGKSYRQPYLFDQIPVDRAAKLLDQRRESPSELYPDTIQLTVIDFCHLLSEQGYAPEDIQRILAQSFHSWKDTAGQGV